MRRMSENKTVRSPPRKKKTTTFQTVGRRWQANKTRPEGNNGGEHDDVNSSSDREDHNDGGNNERLECPRRHRKRGRPVGSKNKNKRAEKRSGSKYGDDDVLKLAKAWVEVSQKGIMRGTDLWEDISKICERRYNLKRTWESLRNKWREVQHEVQRWLAIKDQNETMKPK